MSQSRKCTAIKGLLALALLCLAAFAGAAQVAGTVMNLNGPLLAKKADGSAKILAVKSEVEQGDTLVTEKNTYALIKFIDNSEMTLRPGTTFTIDKFSFDADKADDDSASFTLIKGGLRSLTGLLGKRNKERFSMKTPAATIGIRGTTFIAQYVPPGTPPPGALPPSSVNLAPGLHVQVIDGLIQLTNRGGSLQFSAGQFGFTPSFIQPPVSVPRNPGMIFAPPAEFSMSSAGPVSGGSSPAKAKTVDCEVR